MAISNAKEADIDQALDMVGKSSVDGIYIVDSYGSLYPEQIRAIADKYFEIGEKYGKYIGMHAHNNQQLAFANTIEAAARGVSFLDATMMSMGRGAGNCAMELLLSFLKNPKYNIFPVLKFLEEHMIPLKESGTVWGYDVPYLLTGHLNQHPSAAIDFMKEDRYDYADFYTDLLDK
jgi:4-hydroxy 2-oxovalerate aldolase